jgi:hypothetical protein
MKCSKYGKDLNEFDSRIIFCYQPMEKTNPAATGKIQKQAVSLASELIGTLTHLSMCSKTEGKGSGKLQIKMKDLDIITGFQVAHTFRQVGQSIDFCVVEEMGSLL